MDDVGRRSFISKETDFERQRSSAIVQETFSWECSFYKWMKLLHIAVNS